MRRKSLHAVDGAKGWINPDDATSGAEAGNKVRKLEFLLGDAIARGCDTILTCGGIQSNHARATAITCAQLGLKCVLYLRSDKAPGDPRALAKPSELPSGGNVLLDRLVGAEIHLVTPAEYAQRAAVLESESQRVALAGGKPYVIPEGGSIGLGSLGYVEAMAELRAQMDLGLAESRAPFDEIVHACGSGGTAAGVVLGAAKYEVARRVRAVAVCDDAAYFERTIDRIIVESRGYDPSLTGRAPLVLDESARGPGYAAMNAEQRELLARVARTTGTILDPVYTGKAMHGLVQAVRRGEVAEGARVLFLHTGGLPGLLAQTQEF